jgi:hypothetical protein
MTHNAPPVIARSAATRQSPARGARRLPGRELAASLLVAGVPPVLATLAAIAAGVCAGMVTALIHTKLRIIVPVSYHAYDLQLNASAAAVAGITLRPELTKTAAKVLP